MAAVLELLFDGIDLGVKGRELLLGGHIPLDGGDVFFGGVREGDRGR